MEFINIAKYVILAILILYAIWLPINAYIKTKKIFADAANAEPKRYNNYHTHTLLCDGENTPEEMVEAAIEQGLGELGFSGHSYLPGEDEWTMDPQKTAEYKETVKALKEKYKDSINIRLGIEQDYWSDTTDLEDYDYVIGAVHSISGDDTTWSSVDYKLENFNKCLEQYCDNDIMNMVEKYYSLVGDLYERTHCNIIAHFDLITRFNYEVMKETGSLLVDVNNPRYIAAEKAALEKLIKTPVIFEINTGAMARGYKKVPYPSERILRYLGEHNAPVIISSDSHSKETITYAFDVAEDLVKKYDLNLVEKL